MPVVLLREQVGCLAFIRHRYTKHVASQTLRNFENGELILTNGDCPHYLMIDKRCQFNRAILNIDATTSEAVNSSYSMGLASTHLFFHSSERIASL
jgi:hypothetical protein